MLILKNLITIGSVDLSWLNFVRERSTDPNIVQNSFDSIAHYL